MHSSLVLRFTHYSSTEFIFRRGISVDLNFVVCNVYSLSSEERRVRYTGFLWTIPFPKRVMENDEMDFELKFVLLQSIFLWRESLELYLFCLTWIRREPKIKILVFYRKI